MRHSGWIAGIGLLAGIAFAVPASARCVRDVAESGAVSVRCSDGVRGRLSTDDIAPANPTLTYRPSSSSRNSRSENASALTARDPGLYQFQSGDSTSRPNDATAGALSRSRNMGANAPR